MLVLALDTSTAACSVALVDLVDPLDRVVPVVPVVRAAASEPAASAASAVTGGTRPRVLAARTVLDARRHGEVLAPLISATLADAGVVPADLAAVVVGLGPGPFTSLRVGVATAEVFAAARGLACHGVCSLDGVGAATAGRVAAVTDARRREVYWAEYDDGQRVAGPEVGSPLDVAARLRADGVTAVVGPGRDLYPAAFAAFAEADLARAADDLVPGGGATAPAAGYPDPAVLARVVAPDILLPGRPAPGPLVPLYLRRPDVAEPPAASATPGAATSPGGTTSSAEPSAPTRTSTPTPAGPPVTAATPAAPPVITATPATP